MTMSSHSGQVNDAQVSLEERVLVRLGEPRSSGFRFGYRALLEHAQRRGRVHAPPFPYGPEWREGDGDDADDNGGDDGACREVRVDREVG